MCIPYYQFTRQYIILWLFDIIHKLDTFFIIGWIYVQEKPPVWVKIDGFAAGIRGCFKPFSSLLKVEKTSRTTEGNTAAITLISPTELPDNQIEKGRAKNQSEFFYKIQ